MSRRPARRISRRTDRRTDGRTDPTSRHGGRFPRAPRLTALSLVVIVLACVVGAIGLGTLGVLGPDGRRADRLRAQGINAAIGVCAQTLSAVFGEDMLGADYRGALGLKRYDPALDGWNRLDDPGDALPGRVVLLVHGLDEPGGIWDQLAPALAARGYAVWRYDYANDQAIAPSATGLLGAMDRLSGRGVTRIDLVCHSMGGLVARDAITRPAPADRPIEIGHFITIGSPFGGSPWARLRAAAEIREQVQRWVESDDLDPRRLLGFARDGIGEAGRDLLPGSDFLVALDRRPMPARTRVTCIVGRTMTPMAAGTASLLASGALGELLGEHDAGVIGRELDKLGRELGDGVVPMSSAVLPGAGDVVELSANHRGMIRNVELGVAIREMNGLGPAEEPPAIRVVLDRLARD